MSTYQIKEIDGIKYKVIQSDSAIILDKLNEFVYLIIHQLKTEKDNGQDFGKLNYFVNNLIKKYNPTRLIEGPFIRESQPGSKGELLSNGEPADTSYVINKGEKIVICLRDSRGKFHDMNTLQFVVLHEISHIASIEEQHEQEYWENFKWLLMYTSKRKLYTPVDYQQYPIKYCGALTIDSNPITDSGINLKDTVPPWP